VSYHYVVASLPTLSFGNPPPIRLAEWRRQLNGVLAEADLALVDAVLERRLLPGAPFSDKETQLRNAIARARAAKLGVEARPYIHEHTGFDMEIEDSVTNAFTKENPLDRALELDRCRWRIAEELARPEPFGLATVLAFAAKLRIAERWAGMPDAAGQKTVEDFVSANAQWEIA
jgi:hypothetical protein